MTRSTLKSKLTSLPAMFVLLAAAGSVSEASAQVPIIRPAQHSAPIDTGTRVIPIQSNSELSPLQPLEGNSSDPNNQIPVSRVIPIISQSGQEETEGGSDTELTADHSNALVPIVAQPKAIIAPAPPSVPVPIVRGPFQSPTQVPTQAPVSENMTLPLAGSSANAPEAQPVSSGPKISETEPAPSVGRSLSNSSSPNLLLREENFTGAGRIEPDFGQSLISPAEVASGPVSPSLGIQEETVETTVIEEPIGSSYIDYDFRIVDKANCENSGLGQGYGIGGIGGRVLPTGGLRGRFQRRFAGGMPSLFGPVYNFGFENCGFCTTASRYLQLDALYWTRNDGGVIGTSFGGPDSYPWEIGWRGTYAFRTDKIRGYEFTYFGFMPFENNHTATSPGGAINALFTPEGGFGIPQTAAFYNAVSTSQSLKSNLHSVEFSQMRYGWDVLKTSLGLRYIYFNDDYRLDSQNFFGDVGSYEMKAQNNLFGPTAGLDLYYDVGRRWSLTTKFKGGAYIDAYRFRNSLVHNGTEFLDGGRNSSNISATLEFGVTALYRVAPHVRFRAGYDMLWLYNVVSAGDNFPVFMTPFTGSRIDDSNEANFHGASLGLEFFR